MLPIAESAEVNNLELPGAPHELVRLPDDRGELVVGSDLDTLGHAGRGIDPQEAQRPS